MSLSFAQVAARANGTEIVELEGTKMTKELALAMRSSNGEYETHRQQLRATERLQSTLPGKASLQRAPKVMRMFTDGFPLMELPYDVRHSILEQMIDEQTIKVFLRHSAIPIGLPEAARAGNRLLRRECLLVALKSTTIEVHSGPGNASIQAWLSRISFEGVETSCKDGFDAIRSLKFPYFSRFPYAQAGITVNHDILLCQKSKHLRKLTINFHPDTLIVSRLGPVLKDATAIRQDFQLVGLLDLPNLEELRIETSAREIRISVIHELVAWFDEEFEKRSHKVTVSVHKPDLNL